VSQSQVADAALHVVIADPEIEFGETLARHLRLEGFSVTLTQSAGAALDTVLTGADLLIADMRLPDALGTEVLRRVRQQPQHAALPVLIMGRDDAVDKVVAFEAGADDFIVKPPSLREMGLRVRAILRRTRDEIQVKAPQQHYVGPIAIDLARHEVRADGRLIRLTALEIRVLAFLARDPGRVRSRAELLDEVWGAEWERDLRAVDTTIKRVRKKLGIAGERIETIRGVGYRLRSP
jgi:two-component system phosphate regulon response regulator PhoB